MDRGWVFDRYRKHVNAGKIDFFERYGLNAVMGVSGSRTDTRPGWARRYWEKRDRMAGVPLL